MEPFTTQANNIDLPYDQKVSVSKRKSSKILQPIGMATKNKSGLATPRNSKLQ